MLKLATPLLILSLTGCSDTCSNDVQRAVDAPDGKLTAFLFQRDCGATTDFSTQVSVVDFCDRPSGAGNVFVADTDRGATQREAWGGPWADITWISPKHLLVGYDARSSVFKQNQEVSGVRITFKKVRR